MRYSALYGNTKKETPKDAEIISHKLMLRAGMINKLSSGLYTWLPLGLKVLQKISNIIRAEMNNIGFSEVLMPTVQPAKLWIQSNRWDKYGPLLLKIKDRHDKEYCFGPTHEEIISDVVRQDLSTYKELPIKVYQIQTKFRDEIRPRYGVMRAREFMMKDGYSFNKDQNSLNETYSIIKQAYHEIFRKMGLDVKSVQADTGSIGGDSSHEFHVIANSGEDQICFSDQSDFASNIELCPVIEENKPDNTLEELQSLEHINYVGDLTKAEKYPDKVDPEKILKCIFVKGLDDQIVMIVLKNKHTLNPTKAEKHTKIFSPLKIMSNHELKKIYSIDPCYLGPINSKCHVIYDNSIKNMKNFICGDNTQEKYSINVNWERDLEMSDCLDLRNAENGDLSPDGKGTIRIKKGIEVGHIFKLQDTYTSPMNVRYTNEKSNISTPYMGCYGIGVGRLVAATIEQHHDNNGIIWPQSIAPFEIIIIPINYHKNSDIKRFSEEFYGSISQRFDVLLDDRDCSPGIKFADADLIGIPHRLVISPKLLKDNLVEYKSRTSEKTMKISINDLDSVLIKNHNNSK